MLSREQLISLADALPPLAPPRFSLRPEQSLALKTALLGIDRICREADDCDREAGASLTEQLAAAETRRAALTPAVDDAMAVQEALAVAGLELSVQDGQLVVSRRRSTAPQAVFKREHAE